MLRNRFFLFPAVLLALVACGDDDGRDTPDSSTPMVDGGPPVDESAPRILSTTPDDGADGVGLATEFVATFSEAVTMGTVTVRADGTRHDVDVTLSDDSLTLAPIDGWPSGAEVEVRIEDDFEDEAGNPLDRDYAFSFYVADAAAPALEESVPAEGAANVSVHEPALRLRFTEPMDQAAGTVTLEGPGEIGEGVWSTFEVVYPLSGLENATEYSVTLDGFQDRAGNAATLEILEDDALDFTTRPDDEGPQVVSSTPMEGQLDVLLETLAGRVRVSFDEPMDTTVESAPLSVAGGDPTEVDVEWIDDTTASFVIAGVAQTEAGHALDLRGMRDVIGNLLDEAPIVGDGILDFTTGVDEFVPYVATSTPLEGATEVRFPMEDVRLAFSESMDTTTTEIPVTDETTATRMVEGTWSGGGTVLTLPGSAFEIGLAYMVDVSGLMDLAGTPVSAAHPYLGDGILDFEIEAPTGESCDKALRAVDGEEVMPGTFRFEITNEQRTRNNGSGVCDPSGIAETDAVIHWVKTTPALADGPDGRALRVFTDDVTNRVNVDVLSGVCDPMDAGAAAARQVCFTGHDTVDQLLDLPAGDYYIWVSTADGSAFDIDVEVSEVDSIPAGESCAEPYDDTADFYTAPAAPGEAHLWDVPGATYNSLDVSRSNAPFEAISCAEEPFGDVVLAFEKAEEDTVLDVQVTSGSFSVAAELISGACTRGDGGVTEACDPSMGTSGDRFSANAPAGTNYLWLAGRTSGQYFPGADVSIRELPAPTVAGSSCDNAIEITPSGTVDITPTHAERYFAPSCTPTSSNVTWYAFEATSTLTRIRAVGEGAVGIVEATTGTELACDDEAATNELAQFAPVGTRICVGVESDAAITGLTFTNVDYAGPGTTPPVSLDIDAPPPLTGTPYQGFSVTGDSWMAVTPTMIWQNFGTAGVLFAPKAGGVPIDANLDIDGAALGNGGLAIGEAVYTIAFNGDRRYVRLVNDAGEWYPEFLDVEFDWPETCRTLAYDGTDVFTTVQETSSSADRDFPIYRMSTTTPTAPEVVGRIDTVYYLTGLAADADYFYFTAQPSSSSSTRGVYRVARTDLSVDATTTPELVYGLSTLGTLSAPMKLLRVAGRYYLYVRDSRGSIHVFEDPDGATEYLGVLFDTESSDYGMDIDEDGALYFFGTHLDPEGQWYRMAP